MRITLGRRSAMRFPRSTARFARAAARSRSARARLITVCAALAGTAGLAGCGGSNFYDFNAPAAVVVADFTASGHPGVAVAEAQIDQLQSQEKPGYVALILQNPNDPGTFQSSLHFSTEGNPSAMAVGALTSGTLDLAVANVNDGTISLLMQSSPQAASFEPAVNLQVAPAGSSGTFSPEDVAICDVNGDGNPDIVIGYVYEQLVDGILSPVGGGVSLLEQNGASPGTFLGATLVGSAPTASGNTYPNSVYGIACANLSGDTTAPPDIVLTSYYYYDGSGDYGTLSIFFHDPANPGSFLPRVDISLPGLLHRVAIADVNGDGLPDIIVTAEEPDSEDLGISGIYVLLQNPPATPGAQPTFATPVAYSTATPMALAIGDVNGDGLPDIVFVSSAPTGTGSTNIMLNTPSSPGTFNATPEAYAGLGNPVAVALGELGNNSLLDIATADGTGAVVMFNVASDPGTFSGASLVGG